MMANLASRHCSPVKKGTKPISADVAKSLLNTLRSGWIVDADAKTIERDFRFKNFSQTTGFVNAIAWIANTENHHPDIHIRNNRCKVTYSTREVGGLTVNDFICAAKIDALIKLEKTNKSKLAETPAPPPAVKEIKSTNTAKGNETDKNLKLNMAEAEALLSAEDPEPAATAETPVYEEDEITLFDPDETGNAEEEDIIVSTATNDHTPTIQEKLANSTLEGPEIDVMSTLILPPEADGSTPAEPEHEPPKSNTQNIDVSSTVILPPGMEVSDEEMENYQHVKTMVMPPEPTPDEIKTLALQQDQIDHVDLDTASKSSTKPPQAQAKNEDDQYTRTIMMTPVVIDDKKSEND